MTPETCAYKFLARGRLGPISGFEWPPPGAASGAWVEVEGPLELGVRGLHVLHEADLAHWLHDELWELEIGDERRAGIDCVIVSRARLVRPIEAWAEGGAARFVEACVERVDRMLGANDNSSARALLDDARSAASAGYIAVSAFAAALAVAKLGPRSDGESRFREERAWQSAWIGREVIGDRR